MTVFYELATCMFKSIFHNLLRISKKFFYRARCMVCVQCIFSILRGRYSCCFQCTHHFFCESQWCVFTTKMARRRLAFRTWSHTFLPIKNTRLSVKHHWAQSCGQFLTVLCDHWFFFCLEKSFHSMCVLKNVCKKFSLVRLCIISKQTCIPVIFHYHPMAILVVLVKSCPLFVRKLKKNEIHNSFSLLLHMKIWLKSRPFTAAVINGTTKQ